MSTGGWGFPEDGCLGRAVVTSLPHLREAVPHAPVPTHPGQGRAPGLDWLQLAASVCAIQAVGALDILSLLLFNVTASHRSHCNTILIISRPCWQSHLHQKGYSEPIPGLATQDQRSKLNCFLKLPSGQASSYQPVLRMVLGCSRTGKAPGTQQELEQGL